MVAVDINDREIANVSTYVRNAWGNEASELTEDQVAKIRDSIADMQDQQTGEELQSNTFDL